MFNFFMVLGAIMLCTAPILLIVSIVKTIRKNKPKKGWVLFAITIVLFLAFEITASVFECEHEYNLVEEVSATCTEKGYSKYHCDKCGRDKTDKIDKLGHLMKIVSQVEPTEQFEGEIVRQCERCGYEEVEKVDRTAESNRSDISEMQQSFMDLDYTLEQSVQIENALYEVGITSCKIVASDEETSDGMRVVACTFNDSGTDGYFSTVFGEIAVIGTIGKTWYAREEGGVLSQFSEELASPDNETVSTEAERFAECNDMSVGFAESLEAVLTGMELTDKSRVGVFHYNLSDVYNWKQIDDWASGHRYSAWMAQEHVFYIYEKDGIVVGVRDGHGNIFYTED